MVRVWKHNLALPARTNHNGTHGENVIVLKNVNWPDNFHPSSGAGFVMIAKGSVLDGNMGKRMMVICGMVITSIVLIFVPLAVADTELLQEPIEIAFDPQFFVDDYVVDNRWPLLKREEVLVRTVHQPVKHPANPLVSGRGGYVNVVWDEDAQLYRMLYQDFWYYNLEPLQYTYAIAYAQSKDGIEWEIPDLDLYEWKDSSKNNICWQAPSDQEDLASRVAYSQYLLDIPVEHRRGYKYVMYYVTKTGVYLVGSQDCIHWDVSTLGRIERHPDWTRFSPRHPCLDCVGPHQKSICVVHSGHGSI